MTKQDLRRQFEIEDLQEEARKFDVRALNGRMIRIIGDFGYDSRNRTYQKQTGSFFPPRLSGWVLVSSKPLPTTVAGENQKRTRVIEKY